MRNNSKLIKIVMFFLSLFMSAFTLAAQGKTAQIIRESGILENYLVRENLSEQMNQPVREIKEREHIFPFNGSDQKVKYITRFESNVVLFLFLNQTGAGYHLMMEKGNYLIRRSLMNGRFESIVIFYRDEDFCYLEIIPNGNRSLLNVYLFQRKIYDKISLPLPLETFITAPFAQVVDITSGIIDWSTLLFRGGREEDKKIEGILNTIGNELPNVRVAFDGAINVNGQYVAIASGRPLQGEKGFNCSGFMKWIIDGFYYPLTGKLTDIEYLKQKHFSKRGTVWTEHYEDDQDPFFGLDWTRNLANGLAGAQNGKSIVAGESLDVRHVPFFTYLEDSGYQVKDLILVLYFLAVKEPGTIYLGSINDSFGQSTMFLQYYHVATLLPYFDAAGQFRIIVMDQHKDPNIRSFISKYVNQYIHLVRVKTDGDFSLFHIE
jgi:hypothetical protein